MAAAEWISAIAESVTAVGVILAFLQLRDAREANRENHERSRRESAVQYCLVWSNTTSQYSSNAAKLADALDPTECAGISQRQAVEIHAKHADQLAASFASAPELKTVNGSVSLTAKQSAELRWTILKYLNLLESICAAWHAATVDRKIIEEEFKFLLRPHDGRRLLKNFRDAEGNDLFPAIAAFEEALANATKPDPPRKNLG